MKEEIIFDVELGEVPIITKTDSKAEKQEKQEQIEKSIDELSEVMAIDDIEKEPTGPLPI